jgi:phosphoenolpyruvate carboxylase
VIFYVVHEHNKMSGSWVSDEMSVMYGLKPRNVSKQSATIYSSYRVMIPREYCRDMQKLHDLLVASGIDEPTVKNILRKIKCSADDESIDEDTYYNKLMDTINEELTETHSQMHHNNTPPLLDTFEANPQNVITLLEPVIELQPEVVVVSKRMLLCGLFRC